MKAQRVWAVGLMVGLTLLSSVSAFAHEAQPGDDRGGRREGSDAADLQVQVVQDRRQTSLQGREPEPGDDSRLVLHERELQQRNRRLGQSVIVQLVVNDDKGGIFGLPEPGDDKGGIQAQQPEPGDDNGGLPGQHSEPADDKGGNRGGGHEKGGHA